LQLNVIKVVTTCTENLDAGLDGVTHELGRVDTKISLRGDHNEIKEKGDKSATGVHTDGGKSEKEKTDHEMVVHNLGPMDGARAVACVHEQGGGTAMSMWNRPTRRRHAWDVNHAGRVFSAQHGSKSIYEMNGQVRHDLRQKNNATKFYHRGSSTGGACVTLIVTLTCDMDEALAKFVMVEVAKCLNAIEELFLAHAAEHWGIVF